MYFKTFCLAAMTAVMCLQTSLAEESYMGGQGPIILRPDSTRLLVRFGSTGSTAVASEELGAFERFVGFVEDTLAIDSFAACSLYVASGYMEFVDSINALPSVEFAEPYYRTPEGTAFVIGATLVVSYHDWVSSQQIDSLHSALGVEVVEQIENLTNMFILRNSNNSGLRLLPLVNAFEASPYVVYANPVAGTRFVRSAYMLRDYYHPYQPHVKRVVGAFNGSSVWDFAGLTDTIVVAIIDDGVEAHEDLPLQRILQGRDFASDGLGEDNDPRPGYAQGHGMACAGIVAASHSLGAGATTSETGIISLNPNTRILPVKVFYDDGASVANEIPILKAVAYAKDRADVISISFNNYEYFPAEPYPNLSRAIEETVVWGRNRKGCPVIVSAGNINGTVVYPASLSYCYAVGALQLNDERWPWSAYGSALDACAPSGDAGFYGDMWSLDRMDTLGLNSRHERHDDGTPLEWLCPPGDAQNLSSFRDPSTLLDSAAGIPLLNDPDYTCQWGGTSAACPVVAGVASLILAKDPSLTSYQVYDILSHSADSTLDWGAINDPGDKYYYGAGRVDAFRAILSLSRGDVNNDGIVDLGGDLGALVDFMFFAIEPFPSRLLADCNCDGSADPSDLQYFIDWAVLAVGPPPVKPCFEF